MLRPLLSFPLPEPFPGSVEMNIPPPNLPPGHFIVQVPSGLILPL